MNGVHDMGGMHGFGAVDVEATEAFHDDWERHVSALNSLLQLQGYYSLDEKRAATEQLSPATYLGSSYFELWLHSIEALLVREGVLTLDEIDDRYGQVLEGTASVPERTDSDLTARARAQFETDWEPECATVEPRFEVGDGVVVRNRHPKGHTRAPRYVRRARGTIVAHIGTHPVPDAVVAGDEECEPLYTVRFPASELWGETADGPDGVNLELWESYLGAA